MKYGIMKTEGITDVLVSIEGEQKDGVDADNPRYACKLMGIDGVPALAASKFLGMVGFSLEGYGYPWQSSVEVVEFESEQRAEQAGSEMLIQLRSTG